MRYKVLLWEVELYSFTYTIWALLLASRIQCAAIKSSHDESGGEDGGNDVKELHGNGSKC